MDVDVGSSQTAARVVGIVQGALKGLVIDIAVLLEGKTKVKYPMSNAMHRLSHCARHRSC